MAEQLKVDPEYEGSDPEDDEDSDDTATCASDEASFIPNPCLWRSFRLTILG